MRRAAARVARLVVALACLGLGACAGDGDSDDATPATTAPATAPPSTSAAAGPRTGAGRGGRAAGLPCDGQAFLEVMRDEGGNYDLSPAVLAGIRPEGPPQCDASFASQSFAGPPESPGPYAALFGVRSDGSGWGLVSVNCLSSVSSGQRQVC